VHHGPADADYAWDHKYAADQHVAVILGPSCECEPGKQYKVDVDRKTFVETTGGEQGVNFGFGRTGKLP
jgi:hypothetical protein